jgi:hypothetical protein
MLLLSSANQLSFLSMNLPRLASSVTRACSIRELVWRSVARDAVCDGRGRRSGVRAAVSRSAGVEHRACLGSWSGLRPEVFLPVRSSGGRGARGTCRAFGGRRRLVLTWDTSPGWSASRDAAGLRPGGQRDRGAAVLAALARWCRPGSASRAGFVRPDGGWVRCGHRRPS